MTPEAKAALDKRATVALCIPSGDMCYVDFAFSLAALTYTSLPIARLMIIRGQSSIVTIARDSCIEKMMDAETYSRSRDAGYRGNDWVLFLDSDMTFPPDTLGRLMSHNLDIVCATYVRRYPPHELLGKQMGKEPQDVAGGVHEVDGIPLGVCLIRRKIFDEMKRPYFRLFHNEDTGKTTGEDYYFCHVVKELGYKIHIDFDLTKEIGHIGRVEHRAPVEDASRPQELPIRPGDSPATQFLRETIRPAIIGVRPNGHG